MNKILQNITLFLVIPLYTAQGWLFDSGSAVSQGLVLIWLLVDVYYTFLFLKSGGKTSISQSLLLFWGVLFLSWLFSPKEIHSMGWNISTFGDMKNITIVLLSYFPFRYWLQSDILRKKTLVIFLLLLTFASVIAFITLAKKFDLEFITNNTGYYFAMLVPLLGIIIDKRYTIAILMVLLYFCISSAKRGAILCMTIVFVLFFFYSTVFASSRRRYLTMFFAIVLLMVVVYFSYDIYMANDYLQNRMDKTFEENDTGGRDIIYSSLIKYYLGGNLVNILFGYGMDKTVVVAGNFAHMDWLELLIDNGFIGAVLYFSLFFSMIRYFFKNRKYIGKDVRFMFLSLFIVWLIKSIFSMGYTHFFSFIFLVEYAIFENEVRKYKYMRSKNI